MIDDITDIGINDDKQNEELIFKIMMQMPMQNDAEDAIQDVDGKEKDEEPEEEEEQATQPHTDAPHTKKRKIPIQSTFEC